MENFVQNYLFAHSPMKPHKEQVGLDQKAPTGTTVTAHSKAAGQQRDVSSDHGLVLVPSKAQA